MPSGTLAQLAEDEEAYIRTAVASNEACPVETLQTLAQDNDRTTRATAQTALNRPGPVTPIPA